MQQILLLVVILLEHPPQPIDIGHKISPTEAAIGDPLRTGRARVAFIVEEAVPVQEVVRVDVVGEEMTV